MPGSRPSRSSPGPPSCWRSHDGAAGAGARGDERRDHRGRRRGGRCSRPCSARTAGARPRRARAVRGHPRAASLAVADRGDQVRSQVRGAIVEALTEWLLARRVAAAAVHRERRVLFDGVRAEIHPYDVTVERDGAAEAWDCKWGARGINADVLEQLDDARQHAADEDERLTRRRSWCSTPSGRATFAWSARPRRSRGPSWSVSRRSTGWPARAAEHDMNVADTDRCAAPFRVRFDEAGPDGRLRTSVLLRYAQDLAWFHSASRGLRPGLVRRARAGLAGPRRRGRGPRRGPGRRRARRGDAGRRLASRLGAPADRVHRRATGALVAWVHIDWVLLDARGAPDPHPGRIRRVFGAPRRRSPSRAWRSRTRRRTPTAPRSGSGRRSSTRWITRTTRSTRTGSTSG